MLHVLLHTNECYTLTLPQFCKFVFNILKAGIRSYASFTVMVIKRCVIGVFLVFIFGDSYGQVLNLSSSHPIKDALFLHNSSISNNSLQDCSWRHVNEKNACPDPDINFILYTEPDNKEYVESYKTDWLRQSSWNDTKENIIIIHGYAGGDDTLPISVLRDAYINNGSYNVWILDWGRLSQPPCYSASVHNMRSVAKCAADFLTSMRAGGLLPERTTCVGHSLGAHICGLISKYVLFRLHRIIGLDPARPLVPVGARLSSGDAAAVHALHTNAGNYGEMGKSGHVDFCINGGRVQPYCKNTDNEALCSHVWSICYLAESINTQIAKKAEPCSRRCPTGPRPGHRMGIPLLMGQFTPLTSTGSYCINDDHPPFCPRYTGGPGDRRCCI
ncbi:hypothetical protein ILUMI_22750 [Ignelater luminosus]|uniref:Lipase domain-containing protein n=1 Tax=Ignelater luminosus TaxID=2038154 RepID=A0A8K0CD87_IGNLU|nr:hypothetical protein ILUMI_22750 [Ignelater luminosus]